METTQLINQLATYRKGTYTRATWKTETENGYLKISTNIVRILGGIATSKTGIDYIRLFTTNNHLHKAQVKYFDNNGFEITKEQFESVNPTTKHDITICFTKHVSDIIKLGK